MDVITLLLTETEAPRLGRLMCYMMQSQRADQRDMDGRPCGTGDFTFTVTWYSRMFKETHRSGERLAKRECFKSFICPPSRRDGVVAGQATPSRTLCQGVAKKV